MAVFRMLKRVLAALILVVVGGTFVTPAFAESEECDFSTIRNGACAVNESDKVTLVAEEELDGAGAGSGSSGSGSSTETGSGDHPDFYRDDYGVTGPLTIRDIAHFRPSPGTNHMEPNGWMIVGLPTNFYARASQQIVAGTLLDKPVWVRFTPITYRWTYGDGTARTTHTPGGTWKQLGKNEFDETPASHRYQQPGRYIIHLTIGFAAEWRWADMTDWVPVIGTLALPANPLEAVAGNAKTVLVERDCTLSPTGPGC